MRGKSTANALCIGEHFNKAMLQKYAPKTAPDIKAIALVRREVRFGQSKKEYFFEKPEGFSTLKRIL